MVVGISIVIVTADPLNEMFVTCYQRVREFTVEHNPEVIIVNVVGEEFNYSRSVNMGLRAANGDVIVAMNDDVFVMEGWLDALIEQLNNPEVGVVGGKMLFPDGRVNLCGGTLEFKDGSVETHHLFLGLPYDDATVNVVRDVDYVSGALFAIKRRLLNDVGYLDETLLFNFEETDFCLRARNKGYRIVYAPKCEAIHLEGASRHFLDATELTHDVRVAVAKENFVRKWRSVERNV